MKDELIERYRELQIQVETLHVQLQEQSKSTRDQTEKLREERQRDTEVFESERKRDQERIRDLTDNLQQVQMKLYECNREVLRLRSEQRDSEVEKRPRKEQQLQKLSSLGHRVNIQLVCLIRMLSLVVIWVVSWVRNMEQRRQKPRKGSTRSACGSTGSNPYTGRSICSLRVQRNRQFNVQSQPLSSRVHIKSVKLKRWPFSLSRYDTSVQQISEVDSMIADRLSMCSVELV